MVEGAFALNLTQSLSPLRASPFKDRYGPTINIKGPTFNDSIGHALVVGPLVQAPP